MGACAGGDLDALAAAADRNPPVLRAWDARGLRVDEIVFHHAYREMERLAFVVRALREAVAGAGRAGRARVSRGHRRADRAARGLGADPHGRAGPPRTSAELTVAPSTAL
jgi:hypothetical protein